MNDRIHLLDCTLRDGAYIVEGKFGEPAIRGIISKLQAADVELIECGWLKDAPHEPGMSYYHVPSDLEQYLISKDPRRTYVVMIDWDRYDLSALPEYDGKSVDMVRVVFPRGKHREGIEVGRQIKEKGYKICFQAANTLAYTNEELIDLANCVNAVGAVSLSVVDTFGAMYPEDLERIVSVLDTHLDKNVRLGFHSHNNQQLSFALTMAFVNMTARLDRNIVVDASLCGMGRGAGNATTELVVSFLNRKCGCHYDIDAILDAIDIYMEYFKENYQWGYSTPYFIAGLYCCHVNNIAYLLKNHRTSAKDMHDIIESLAPEDRKKYDYDLLEQKYLKNQSYYVDDAAALETLRQELAGREIVLIAPGKSAQEKQAAVKAYIQEKNAVVIAVNAVLPGYTYDYLFFANPARYEYARNAFTKVFDDTAHIVLSNVKNTAASGETVIAFGSVIKRGWPHYDNATICCLRLMERLGIGKIAVAGLDGFRTRYNESYADPFLPSLNPEGKWDELNREILEMYNDFKANAVCCKEILYLTPSYYEQQEKNGPELKNA